jgi:hypothetical protein
MRDAYPQAAEAAEGRLASAGLGGAEWAWEEQRRRYGTGQRLALVPASIPTGKTKADFVACMEALACKECGKRGAATAQCACCAEPLCPRCLKGCEEDACQVYYAGTRAGAVECPFAVCVSCAAAHSRRLPEAYAAAVLGPSSPGYIYPACSKCPLSARRCPAHPEPGYTTCTSCHDRRCAEHMHDAPAQKFCIACGPSHNFDFVLCDRRACHQRSRHRKLLGCVSKSCRKLACNRCAGAGRVCPKCGTGGMVEYMLFLR